MVDVDVEVDREVRVAPELDRDAGVPPVQGTAEGVSDHAELGRVANTYESKYGPHFVAPEGTWSGLRDAIRQAEVLVYRVAPETGFGFVKGESFSQTRWSF